MAPDTAEICALIVDAATARQTYATGDDLSTTMTFEGSQTLALMRALFRLPASVSLPHVLEVSERVFPSKQET